MCFSQELCPKLADIFETEFLSYQINIFVCIIQYSMSISFVSSCNKIFSKFFYTQGLCSELLSELSNCRS